MNKLLRKDHHYTNILTYINTIIYITLQLFLGLRTKQITSTAQMETSVSLAGTVQFSKVFYNTLSFNGQRKSSFRKLLEFVHFGKPKRKEERSIETAQTTRCSSRTKRCFTVDCYSLNFIDLKKFQPTKILNLFVFPAYC